MEFLALFILILSAMTGFIAIFFTTFGTLIIFTGCLIYAAMTGFSVLTLKYLFILFVLYALGEIMEYFFIIAGAKKFGASNKAVIGAIIGGIVGALLGAGILGIGLIIGTFFGIFIGAFSVELLTQKDLIKSIKAGTGGVLGRIGSIAAKLVIVLIMLTIITVRIIHYSSFLK
jgi:uncharacterized protein YqgC (DUF456 family)